MHVAIFENGKKSKIEVHEGNGQYFAQCREAPGVIGLGRNVVQAILSHGAALGTASRLLAPQTSVSGCLADCR